MRVPIHFLVCARNVAVVAAVVISACSDPEPPEEPSLATTEQDIFEEPTTCSTTTLGGACRGPWQYKRYVTPCWQQEPDPACPFDFPSQCPTNCLHAELGFTKERTQPVVCTNCSRAVLEALCEDKAEDWLDSVYGSHSQVTLQWDLTSSSHEGTRWEGMCWQKLTNVRQSVHSSCPKEACMIQNPAGCRLPSHGEDIGGCGTETTPWRASAPGLTKAQIDDADQYADLATANCSTLEGTTVNAARLTLTVARSSSSHAYWPTLPATAAQETAARRDLVKNAKLMFELGTSAGTNSEAIRSMYVTAPADVHSCGVSAQAPVSAACVPFATTNQLAGPLSRCLRMLSSHVTPAVMTGEINGCLDLLARPELATTEACAVEHRDVIEQLVERLLVKGLNDVQEPTAGVLTGLATVLTRIDRWHAGAALAFATAPEALSDARGRVLKAFWERVYAVGATPPIFASGQPGTEIARAQLAVLFFERIEVDRQVLAAAFANPAPLDEVPLLLITADALSSISERLRSAAPLYDFACRIKDGCTVDEANEATRILRIIGAIGNADDLAAALTAGAGGAVRAPWHQAFTALQARRAALQSAYRKATARPTATLDELYLPDVVPVAAGLAELLTGTRAMWISYAGSGILLPRDGDVIRTSLVDSKIVDALTAFASRRGDLRQQREDYQRARGDFANTILSRINNRQYAARLAGEIAVAQADYDKLALDLDGLTASQGQAEQMIGKFLETYIERAGNPGWFPDYPINGNPGFIPVGAAQARGSGSMASDAAAVAVHVGQATEPWKLTVAKGDMLTLHVTGSWSPTCALRGTTLAGPNGTISFADPSHFFTGPEGFSVSFQNNQFHAEEHSSIDFTTETTQGSICGALNAAYSTVSDNASASLSGSASACKQWTTGHTEQDTTTDGSRFGSTASFAGGMRIPGTPFPTFPGGSLLLVEVVTGATGDPIMRDAHVVRPNSTFLFPEDATVYLVANDMAGCDVVDESDVLSINYVLGKSSVPAARELAEGMANALAMLKTEGARYVAQGSVTPNELTSLQNVAYDELRTACDCVLSAFPEEIRGMFDAWLSTELASIERQTRIAAAAHSLDTLALRLASLQEDLAGNADASRLLALMTTWQLGHLAFPQLRAYAELLLESGNDNMMPMMRIMYPSALTVLRTQSTVEVLRSFDWTLPYDEQVNKLEVVADDVKARIDAARLTGGQASAPVMVAFPKPSPNGTPPAPISGAVIASPERLTDVWEECPAGFCLRRRPVFTITPGDVYGEALVGLGCQEASPIVQTFAIFSANDGNSGNQDWNNNPHRGDIFRTQDALFPTERGVLGYRMEGPIAPSRVRVLAGRAANAWTVFDTFVRNGNELHGVSAFGSFAVELGDDVANPTGPLGSASAIIVTADLLTRTAAGPLEGVAACTQPGAATAAAPPSDSRDLAPSGTP
jgi:hypothetical protein